MSSAFIALGGANIGLIGLAGLSGPSASSFRSQEEWDEINKRQSIQIRKQKADEAFQRCLEQDAAERRRTHFGLRKP